MFIYVFVFIYFIYKVFINIHKYASENFVSHSKGPTEQFGMNLKALGVQDISYLNPSPRLNFLRDFPSFFLKFSCIFMNVQMR